MNPTQTDDLNVNRAETGKFDKLAAGWWDPEGESRPLHDLNPVRLNYVAERAALKGARVLDVARLHLHESNLQVDYREISVEALAQASPGEFDVVTCMEMLEHVPDPGSVIAACAALLKPGGRLFLSTLNRTPLAFGAAIVGAEYALNLLPRGTHHYAQFIRPAEMAAALRDAGLVLEDLSGLAYNPLSRRAWLMKSTQINYLACAAKPCSIRSARSCPKAAVRCCARGFRASMKRASKACCRAISISMPSRSPHTRAPSMASTVCSPVSRPARCPGAS